MWTVVKVLGTEEILRFVLDQWKAGVDAHEPQKVAAVFTEDTIFQGLRPYIVGRQGVADYYDAQPREMTVTYRILETRRPAEELVLGYVRADFAFPDGHTVGLNLGVLVTHGDDGWRILHYQASPAI
ncbi:MAG: hypothetical protein QOF47_2732 [Mycobacterium sp.]|jgi:uncharacterized protein (TIGR02246 family)|nr:hypothetical protein [Mycobacterium sp.]MDT5333253.1 hypothetical protein [Mycobacterium sp.]